MNSLVIASDCAAFVFVCRRSPELGISRTSFMMAPSIGPKAGDYSRRRSSNDGTRAKKGRIVMLCLSIVRTSGFVVTELRPPPHRPIPMERRTAAANDVLERPPGLVALEFYSGIGGLRVSLEKATAASSKVAVGGGYTERPAGATTSFEINYVANSVSSSE